MGKFADIEHFNKKYICIRRFHQREAVEVLITAPHFATNLPNPTCYYNNKSYMYYRELMPYYK